MLIYYNCGSGKPFTSSLRRLAQKVLTTHPEVGGISYADLPIWHFLCLYFFQACLLLQMNASFPLDYYISIRVECPWLRWDGLSYIHFLTWVVCLWSSISPILLFTLTLARQRESKELSPLPSWQQYKVVVSRPKSLRTQIHEYQSGWEVLVLMKILPMT